MEKNWKLGPKPEVLWWVPVLIRNWIKPLQFYTEKWKWFWDRSGGMIIRLLGTGCCNTLHTGSTCVDTPSPFQLHFPTQVDVLSRLSEEEPWWKTGDPWGMIIGCSLSEWDPDSKLHFSIRKQYILVKITANVMKMFIKFRFLFS